MPRQWCNSRRFPQDPNEQKCPNKTFSSRRSKWRWRSLHWRGYELSRRVDQTNVCFIFIAYSFQHCVNRKHPITFKWLPSSLFRDTMDLTEEQVQNLEDVFRQNLPPDQNTLTLKEFKKFMPSKNVRHRSRFHELYQS